MARKKTYDQAVFAFWKNVEVKENDECWNWKRSVVSHGYGNAWSMKRFYGTAVASRIAYILAYGLPEKEKPLVLHECDNPLCCNPSHLFAGTHNDNMDDMKRKKRYKITRGNLKLSDSQVVEIRKERVSGLDYSTISKKYNVSTSTIRNICARRARQDVL